MERLATDINDDIDMIGPHVKDIDQIIDMRMWFRVMR